MPNGQFDAMGDDEYEELGLMDWLAIQSDPGAYPEGILDEMPEWVAEAIAQLRAKEGEEPPTD